MDLEDISESESEPYYDQGLYLRERDFIMMEARDMLFQEWLLENPTLLQRVVNLWVSMKLMISNFCIRFWIWCQLNSYFLRVVVKFIRFTYNFLLCEHPHFLCLGCLRVNYFYAKKVTIKGVKLWHRFCLSCKSHVEFCER
jgi:hypothetical protein